MKDAIETGDIVNIDFNNESWLIDCEVLYVPCFAGDSWRLRRKDKELIYVQSFETMLLKEKRHVDDGIDDAVELEPYIIKDGCLIKIKGKTK